MSEAKRRIAINTGGGDAPGLNAVIHGVAYAARGLGCKVVGIRLSDHPKAANEGQLKTGQRE